MLRRHWLTILVLSTAAYFGAAAALSPLFDTADVQIVASR